MSAYGDVMIFVSQLIDLACLVGGPRLSHRVYLRRLERWRTFEAEYYLLDHLIDPNQSSIDVGGNEGIYAGRMAQLCQQVHCFEPNPRLASGLRERLPDNAIVHECALSDRTGNAELRIPYSHHIEMHGGATIEDNNALSGRTHIKRVPCKIARLDDLINEPVGFMKIDVEGHEGAVLAGARRILRDSQPLLLIESEKRHNAAQPESVFKFLSDLGYRGFFLQDRRPIALDAFKSELHQRIENLDSIGKAYFNNFVFLPGQLRS